MEIDVGEVWQVLSVENSSADCMEGPEGIQKGARSHSHIRKAVTDLWECCSAAPEEDMKTDTESGCVCQQLPDEPVLQTAHTFSTFLWGWRAGRPAGPPAVRCSFSAKAGAQSYCYL